MSKPLRALTVSLQLFALAASCAAQGVPRPPKDLKDEEPLAAALRLARRLRPESEKDELFVKLVDAHREAGRLEEAARGRGDGRRRDEGRRAQPHRQRVRRGGQA